MKLGESRAAHAAGSGPDAADRVWRLPEGFCGPVSIWVENKRGEAGLKGLQPPHKKPKSSLKTQFVE